MPRGAGSLDGFSLDVPKELDAFSRDFDLNVRLVEQLVYTCNDLIRCLDLHLLINFNIIN